MQALLPRCAALMTLLAVIAGVGTLQRVWQHRVLVALEKAADSANPGLQQARQLKEQIDRLHEEMGRLPPESRAMVQDLLTARNGEAVANPLVLSLARFGGVEPEATLEERVIAGAKAVEAAWLRAEDWIVRALWLLAGLCVALGVAGIALGQDRLLTLAAGGAAAVPLVWFVGLSFGCAAYFAATGRNPWGSLPLSFYAAPGGLWIGGLLLKLQEGRQPDEVVPDALFAVAAPACSFAVVAVLGILG